MTSIIKAPMETTVLYNGSKVTSGTITLSDAPTNYDALIIYSQTNAEFYYDILVIDDKATVGHNLMLDHNYQTGNYFSGMLVNTTANGLYVNSSSNNANWILGVVKVVGIKFA